MNLRKATVLAQVSTIKVIKNAFDWKNPNMASSDFVYLYYTYTDAYVSRDSHVFLKETVSKMQLHGAQRSDRIWTSIPSSCTSLYCLIIFLTISEKESSIASTE
jgi:hypothetical protein